DLADHPDRDLAAARRQDDLVPDVQPGPSIERAPGDRFTWAGEPATADRRVADPRGIAVIADERHGPESGRVEEHGREPHGALDEGIGRDRRLDRGAAIRIDELGP